MLTINATDPDPYQGIHPRIDAKRCEPTDVSKCETESMSNAFDVLGTGGCKTDGDVFDTHLDTLAHRNNVGQLDALCRFCCNFFAPNPSAELDFP